MAGPKDVAVIARTIGLDTKRIVLDQAEISRPIPFSSWNNLLLLIRFSINGTTLGSGALQFAFQSTASSTLMEWTNGGAAPTHSWRWFNGGAATYVGGPPNYFHSGTSLRTQRIVSTTTSQNTVALDSGDQWASASPTTHRQCVGYTLNKTNAALTTTSVIYRTSGSLTDLSDAQFQALKEGVVPSGYVNTGGAAGLVIDEATNGNLDRFCIFYNDPSSELEISDISLTKLS